jgi:transcription initiation factor TFIIE subunit alpha
MNRIYYYIDYRATIDAIKWRVYQMSKKVQGNTVATDEIKEWFCSRCHSQWTAMEILDRWRPPHGFLCPKCENVLVRDPDHINRGGHEQSTKWKSQFDFIVNLLPKIDEAFIPENTFEKAYASARKVIRDETNPANETAPIDPSAAKPTAVRGMTNVGPTSINVTLTASEGPTEADIAAEKARKEKIAAQNAMPYHFTHSTITKLPVNAEEEPAFQSSEPLDPDKKNLDLDTPSVNGDGAEIDDYFARLKAEQAREAEQEQDEEYETDDEDDEDGFEDVVQNGGSGAGTPASSAGDNKPTLANGLTGVLKKNGSVSGSGTSTGVTSPVTGPGTPMEEGRPAKKVRIEEPAAKDEEESEEDMEFEDV